MVPNFMMKVIGERAPTRSRSSEASADALHEIDMMLDDSVTHVRAGDVIVQQATITRGPIAARSPAASCLR